MPQGAELPMDRRHPFALSPSGWWDVSWSLLESPGPLRLGLLVVLLLLVEDSLDFSVTLDIVRS